MQVKLFTIPINDASGNAEAELNKFLRSHKVLELVQHFCAYNSGAAWHFCVKYLDSPYNNQLKASKSKKTDYKNILDEKTFEIFNKLRQCRKTVANEFAVPAFAIFTDEQMANVAKLEDINEKTMVTVSGIGEKTIQKFGKRILELLNEEP